MPDFVITDSATGKKYKVTAPDVETAYSSFKEMQGGPQEYVQPTPPPGVVIHGGDGKDYLSKGDHKYETLTRGEAQMMPNLETGTGRANAAAASFMRGVPVIGPFMDRAVAGADALMGGDYAQRLALEQDRKGAYEKSRPIESTALEMGGALAGTAALAPVAAGPGAGGGAARVVTGLGAQSVPGAIGRGMVAGTIQGAAAGAGDTRDLTQTGDALYNTGVGAGIGAGAGALIPAMLAGGAKAIDWARSRGADMLSSVPADAQKWLLGQTDPARLRQMQAEMLRLGPEAMPADVSPTWQGIARASAARPETRDMIVEPLKARDAAKNARIAQMLRDNVGDPQAPSRLMAGIKTQMQALGPAYDDALSKAKAVDTKSIADDIVSVANNERGAARDALMDVRRMLDLPDNPGTLDPLPQALHKVRQAIDGKMGDTMDGNVKRVLGDVRKKIDTELQAKVPGIKDIDAQYRELSRQFDVFDERRGTKVLENGKTALWPEELGDQLTAGVTPQGTLVGPSGEAFRLRQDTVADLYRVVGTNANDVSALNRLIKGEGDWNRNKLSQMFGAEKARKMFDILDAEVAFQDTANRVTRGSDTAMAQGFGQFLDNARGGIPNVEQSASLTGLTGRMLTKGINLIADNQAAANAARFADSLGQLSVSQGPQAQQVIADLLRRAQQSNSLQGMYGAAGATGAPAAALARALIESDPSNPYRGRNR